MKTLLPLLALTAVLSLTLTACDSSVSSDSGPDLSGGDQVALGKDHKTAYCHNGWTSNEAGVLTQQYYLIEVNNSLVNGKGKGNSLSHDSHHPEQLDAWGNTVDPDDDYVCSGPGYAVEDGVCVFEGVAEACEKDSDGDGVWDSADACPDTPKGDPVGPDGCAPSACPTNSIGMEFTLIEAGTFEMGSTTGNPDEAPVHTVTITRDFCLGTYEVTQRQWRLVMGNPPVGFSFDSCSGEADDNCPAEQVSWNDVQSFITTLNADEGTTAYRLPTEAEWEYAARAGTTTEYSFGEDYPPSSLDTYAWYANNSSSTTHAVGGRLANPWGLYDVHGNVWEWVQDLDGVYPSGSVSDPTGPATGSSRVRRGGGWNDLPFNLRSASRDGMAPDYRDGSLGFRLLRSAS